MSDPLDIHLPAGLTRRGMLQQLMDNISDNIYFMDAKGHILLVNRAGARWLGFKSPEEVIGKTDYDLFTEEHAAAAFADEQRIIATGQPVIGIEEKETWPDGHTTWVSTTKMPLRDDDGNIVGVFGISRNITEHKERQLLIHRMKEQMESELRLAGEVQRSFLAPKEIRFAEFSKATNASLHIVREYRPSGQVGGDFFCLLPLSATCAGIFIADVMGHGVGAALLMSALNALVRSDLAKSAAPAEFLQGLNRRLRQVISCEEVVGFITAFYIVVDTADGSIRYSNAGHHPPVVIRAGSREARPLCSSGEIGGPALMLLPDASLKERADALAPGDRLLLFTDGLMEMPSSAGSEKDFELEGLLRLITELSTENLPALIKDVIASVLAASGLEAFNDDVCLIGIEYQKPAV